MSAQVIPLRHAAPPEDIRPLMAAVVELHALISLDPTMGGTAARILFAFNPAAKGRISACLASLDPVGHGPSPAAFALVAYDFPFAIHLLEMAGRRFPKPRAQEIVSLSAALLGDTLQAAARSLRIDARPVLAFDAGTLKQHFFPNTQESLTHLFSLQLGAPDGPAAAFPA